MRTYDFPAEKSVLGIQMSKGVDRVYRIKAILVCAGVGSIVGLLSAASVILSTVIFFGQIESLGQNVLSGLALALFSLLNSLIVGGLRGVLGPTFKTREFSVFSVLISIAMASIRIMAGDFAANSLVPVVIYCLAAVNGVVAPPVVVHVLCRSRIGERIRFAA